MYQIDFHKPLHIHFIGIGGISMSGLAEILLEEGFTVSGSDSKESPLTKMPWNLKVHIFSMASVLPTSLMTVSRLLFIQQQSIRTIRNMHALSQKGLPMLTRAQLLGQIMRNYDTSIAVSGTHGKTTTTSMISHILLEGECDPTISVGGILPAIGGNIRVGTLRDFPYRSM